MECTDVLLAALKVRSKHRTETHINEILVGLRNIKFFQELDVEIRQKCAVALQCRSVPAGHTVFKQGDTGSLFYVIGKGSVGVYVVVSEPKAESKVEPSELSPTCESRRSMANGRASTMSPRMTNVLSPTRLTNPRSSMLKVRIENLPTPKPEPVLTRVATLHAGQAFGEVALQTKAPRNATIMTHGDCVFVTLDRHDYRAILSSVYLAEEMVRTEFLKSVKFLPGSFDSSSFLHHFRLKKFKRLEYVCRRGDPLENIYVIKDGKFGVISQDNQVICLLDPRVTISFHEYVANCKICPHDICSLGASGHCFYAVCHQLNLDDYQKQECRLLFEKELAFYQNRYAITEGLAHTYSPQRMLTLMFGKFRNSSQAPERTPKHTKLELGSPRFSPHNLEYRVPAFEDTLHREKFVGKTCTSRIQLAEAD